MKIYPLAGLLFIFSLVATCASNTTTRYVNYGSPDYLSGLSDEELEVYFAQYCQGLGFSTDSEEFFNCVVEQYQSVRFGAIRNGFFGLSQDR